MNTATAEQEIHAVLDRWTHAVCSRDLDGVMACYAADVRAFDAIARLQFQGVQSYRKHYEYCLGFMDGEMLFEIHEPAIVVRDDIAFSHFLAYCGCTDENGTEQVGWSRGTVCLQKTDGEWRIVHEHYSMPFDPETMKILDELEP